MRVYLCSKLFWEPFADKWRCHKQTAEILSKYPLSFCDIRAEHVSTAQTHTKGAEMGRLWHAMHPKIPGGGAHACYRKDVFMGADAAHPNGAVSSCMRVHDCLEAICSAVMPRWSPLLPAAAIGQNQRIKGDTKPYFRAFLQVNVQKHLLAPAPSTAAHAFFERLDELTHLNSTAQELLVLPHLCLLLSDALTATNSEFSGTTAMPGTSAAHLADQSGQPAVCTLEGVHRATDHSSQEGLSACSQAPYACDLSAQHSPACAPGSISVAAGSGAAATQNVLVSLAVQLLFQKGSKPLHKALLLSLQNILPPHVLSGHLRAALHHQMGPQMVQPSTTCNLHTVTSSGLNEVKIATSKPSESQETCKLVVSEGEERGPVVEGVTGVASASAWASLLAFGPASDAVAACAALALSDLAGSSLRVLESIRGGQHVSPVLAIELQVRDRVA
jgi:hypothetical protein